MRLLLAALLLTACAPDPLSLPPADAARDTALPDAPADTPPPSDAGPCSVVGMPCGCVAPGAPTSSGTFVCVGGVPTCFCEGSDAGADAAEGGDGGDAADVPSVTDVAVDTTADSGPDAPSDVLVVDSAPVDAGADVAMDARADAALDAADVLALDVGADAALDAAPDVAADVRVDAGCLADVAADPMNCGACGHACAFFAAAATCVRGVCVMGACIGGYHDCDGNQANGCELYTAVDVNNCGACGNVCVPLLHTVPTCLYSGASGGHLSYCVFDCAAGFGNCDDNISNGCETNINTVHAHCGVCGHACTSAQACVSGHCV